MEADRPGQKANRPGQKADRPGQETWPAWRPDLAEPDPVAVAVAFGLRGAVSELTPVGGAWSNRVYRFAAGDHRFAVKEMRNPWADPRWQEWLVESWDYENRAIAAGVAAPSPVPNPTDGGCLAWVSRRDPTAPEAAVRVHRWVTGTPVGTAPVTPEIARWAGQTLATLHRLRVKPRDRNMFPHPNTETADRWPELAAAAERRGVPWAPLLNQVAPAVEVIAELAHAAGSQPDQEVMSHGDIDQKNLLACAGGPVLCDWDMAVPVLPRRELADVALSLGCWQETGIARRVVASYRAAGGDDKTIEPCDLGPSLMNGLDWAAFNVERAIGLRPATTAEADLARRLVPGLLTAVPKEVDTTLRVTAVLGP